MATEAFKGAGFDAYNLSGGLLGLGGLRAAARAGERLRGGLTAGARRRRYGFHLIEQPSGSVSAGSGSLPASTASSAARSHPARWPGSW